MLLTGLSVAALGLMILGVATQVDGSYLGVLGGLFPMSVGMGAVFVTLTLVATTGVDESDAGLASGIFNTSQQVGGALGLAILSTLANERTTGILADLTGQPTQAQVQSALVEGFQLAFFVAAGLLAVGALLLGLLLRQRDVAKDRCRRCRPSPRLARYRADAARNRELIIAAAAAVFAERGLDAATAEIAHRAGVGEATPFRRFPTKDDLIDAIIETRMEEVAALADAAAEHPRPGRGARALHGGPGEAVQPRQGLLRGRRGALHQRPEVPAAPRARLERRRAPLEARAGRAARRPAATCRRPTSPSWRAAPCTRWRCRSRASETTCGSATCA